MSPPSNSGAFALAAVLCANTGYSGLIQITADNNRAVVPKWAFHRGAHCGQEARGRHDRMPIVRGPFSTSVGEIDDKHALDVTLAGGYWYWLAGIWLPIYVTIYFGPSFL